MKKIAFFFGGRGTEHDVSRASAAALLPRLLARGLELFPVYVHRDGSLYRLLDPSVLAHGDPLSACVPVAVIYGGGTLSLESGDGTAFVPELCLSVLHGTYGEDGAWQGLFTLSGIPFVGSGVAASALSMNKVLAKELALSIGIPTARYLSVRDASDTSLSLVEARLPYPVFVKPVSGGSSLGASRAEDKETLRGALEAALSYDEEALVEEFIEGRELSVALLEREGELIASPVGMILTKGVFDYHEKYESQDAHLAVPAPIDAQTALLAQHYARRIFRRLGCRHLARVDLFYTERGILFNEINTLPGFTDASLYTALFSCAGIDALSLLLSEAER